MGKKKYKLLKVELTDVSSSIDINQSVKMYRIVALVDIPEHGVKKGDLGGYVSGKYILSHEGSCWIGGNAKVRGHVEIKDNAYVGGNSNLVSLFPNTKLIVKDSSSITDNAEFLFVKYKNDDPPQIVAEISGFAKIFGNAIIYNVESIRDNVKIYGNVKIDRSKAISGESEIYGSAKLESGVTIEGKTRVYGDAVVSKNVQLTDCVVKEKAQIGEDSTFSDASFEDEAIFREAKKEIPEIVVGMDGSNLSYRKEASPALPEPSGPAAPISFDQKANRALALFGKLQKDIASYETDIVKIIKYPVMTDRTNDYTMDMVIALSNAEELSADPEDQEFKDSVKELQKRFLAAESNALKIASTLLTEEERKKTEKAKDLLAIAADDGSTENEKKVSFKQAFKQLEGVIVVPEVAVDTFRVKIGLQELEM